MVDAKFSRKKLCRAKTKFLGENSTALLQIESDVILYKLIIDFYYWLHLKSKNCDVLLAKVIPTALLFYRGVSRRAFNSMITDLFLVRNDRKQRIESNNVDGETLLERSQINALKEWWLTTFRSTF